MYLDQAKKQEIFGQYGKSNSDTGSAESQIALFSYRISHLTEHLKKNRKDYNTERSLTMLVGSVVVCSTICTTATSNAIAPSSRLLVCVAKTPGNNVAFACENLLPAAVVRHVFRGAFLCSPLWLSVKWRVIFRCFV